MADTYAQLAEKRNDKELYGKAFASYNADLEGFTQMKNEGSLAEYDNKLFDQVETGIKKVENKLGK